MANFLANGHWFGRFSFTLLFGHFLLFSLLSYFHYILAKFTVALLYSSVSLRVVFVLFSPFCFWPFWPEWPIQWSSFGASCAQFVSQRSQIKAVKRQKATNETIGHQNYIIGLPDVFPSLLCQQVTTNHRRRHLLWQDVVFQLTQAIY